MILMKLENNKLEDNAHNAISDKRFVSYRSWDMHMKILCMLANVTLSYPNIQGCNNSNTFKCIHKVKELSRQFMGSTLWMASCSVKVSNRL